MADRKVPRSLTWIAALAILGVSGLVQGRLTGRWSTSKELSEAVVRLSLLPKQVGTWSGEDVDPDLATLHRIGIADGVVRRYRDAKDGSTITVMVVCGRPGPVSVHTPDVCYGGAGYSVATPPAEVLPGFMASTMVRPSQAIADNLQVYWSWNALGRWAAPSNPRFAFGNRPYLFKLYVIRPVRTPSEPLDSGPGADFAKALASTFDPSLPSPARN